MKNIRVSMLTVLSLVCFQCTLKAETISVIAFSIPPLMGESLYSKDGLQIELLKEIFKVSAIDLDVVMLPRARANFTFEKGEIPLFLGPIETLNEDFRRHVTAIPLFVTQTVVFYSKSRYPNFSWKQYSDLKNYVIGVLLGGSVDKLAKANGLKTDPVVTTDQLFKKLNAERNDLVIAADLSGKLSIEKIFPEKVNEFAYDEETPFSTPLAQVIVNNEHIQSTTLIPKMTHGLEVIFTNGTWLNIMEKYYGKGHVPERSIALIKDFIKSK